MTEDEKNHHRVAIDAAKAELKRSEEPDAVISAKIERLEAQIKRLEAEIESLQLKRMQLWNESFDANIASYDRILAALEAKRALGGAS
jgi:hypothetical protein